MRRSRRSGYTGGRGFQFYIPLTFVNRSSRTGVVHKITLVGETIGERPNSYSENDEMRLPESRLQVSYSTMFYKFLPDDGLVTPDKEIQPTWADWVAGRDPVLDWIVSQ